MRYLRQSTTATIKLGPFLDDTTGKDAEAALSPAVKLSKNGGALAARDSATPVAHDADGYYAVELDATDTGTIGRLRVAATATGALPVWDDFAVLHASVYDWLFGDAAPSTATPLDAAGVRGALGMATADLDAQLGGLSTFDAGVTPVLLAADQSAVLALGGLDVSGASVDANLVSVDSGLTADTADIIDGILDAFGVRGSVNDASPTASGFGGDSGLSSVDGFYVGAVLAFRGGTLDGQARKVTGYTGSTRAFAFATAFTAAPADEDEFVVLGRIEG